MTASIQSLVKYFKRQDLTGNEITQATGKPPVIFSDLKKYSSLEQLLGKEGYVVILLQVNSANSGHWVAITKDDNTGKFRWCDPYGIPWMVEIRDYVPFDHTNFPNYIKELFSQNNQQTEYNTVDYQAKQPGISTCGRYATLFTKLRNISLKQIDLLFKTNSVSYLQDSDNLVTLLTLLMMGNIPEYFEKQK